MKRKVFVSRHYPDVEGIGRKIMSMGYIPFVPRTMYDSKLDPEQIVEISLAFLHDCDIVLAPADWRKNVAAEEEITLTERLHLSVVHDLEELNMFRKELQYPAIGSHFFYGGTRVIVTKQTRDEYGDPAVMFREYRKRGGGMYVPLQIFNARAKRMMV